MTHRRRAPPHRAGEGTDLARVDDRDRQTGCGQGRGEADLHAARGFEHDERRCKGNQALDQRHYALLVIVEGEALAGGVQVDVEPALGNVDADEGGWLVHDPFSLNAGWLALVTVRVGEDAAGGAPSFASALMDLWDSGLPPA